MQFTHKEIHLLRDACIFIEQRAHEHLGEYDKLIHKLDSYEQEYDCPGCWDPHAEHTCMMA